MPDIVCKTDAEIAGEKIAKIRESQNLSQYKLAEKAGISRDIVRRIELGQSGKLDDIGRICDVLNISILEVTSSRLHPKNKLASLNSLINRLPLKQQEEIVDRLYALVAVFVNK